MVGGLGQEFCFSKTLRREPRAAPRRARSERIRRRRRLHPRPGSGSQARDTHQATARGSGSAGSRPPPGSRPVSASGRRGQSRPALSCARLRPLCRDSRSPAPGLGELPFWARGIAGVRLAPPHRDRRAAIQTQCNQGRDFRFDRLPTHRTRRAGAEAGSSSFPPQLFGGYQILVRLNLFATRALRMSASCAFESSVCVFPKLRGPAHTRLGETTCLQENPVKWKAPTVILGYITSSLPCRASYGFGIRRLVS